MRLVVKTVAGAAKLAPREKEQAMNNRNRLLLCAALLAAPAGALAAQLCDGSPCSVQMEFPGGGSIETDAGAQLVFGSGGQITLGTGGTIEPGPGGSVTPAAAAGTTPDMSSGGSITLGPGGAIHFGAGGSLGSGDGGQISVDDAGKLDVRAARTLAVRSALSVHVGDLAANSVTVEAAGALGNASIPINFLAAEGDADSQLSIQSDQEISIHNVNGGTVVVSSGSGAAGGGSGSSSAGGTPSGSSSGSSLTACSGSDCPTVNNPPPAQEISSNGSPNISCDPNPCVGEVRVLSSPSGGGTLSGLSLMLLLGSMLRRRPSPPHF